MSTIDNKGIIDTLIKNNGVWPGDEDKPPVTKIVEYTNQWGGLSTAVVYKTDNQNKYEESPACINVKTIWIRTE